MLRVCSCETHWDAATTLNDNEKQGGHKTSCRTKRETNRDWDRAHRRDIRGRAEDVWSARRRAVEWFPGSGVVHVHSAYPLPGPWVDIRDGLVLHARAAKVGQWLVHRGEPVSDDRHDGSSDGRNHQGADQESSENGPHSSSTQPLGLAAASRCFASASTGASIPRAWPHS